MPKQKSTGDMSKMEPGNILIVDDDANHLYIYKKMLAAPGRTIHTAQSGDAALKILLKKETISLILMDVKMPGMSGFDTLQLIRQRKKLRDIPIIFISGAHQTEEFVRSGFRLGAYDYILSPPNEEYLKNKVNVFLTLYRQKEELSRKTEELARQKAQIETILTTVSSILIVLDKDANVISVNQAFDHIRTKYPKISLRHFVSSVEDELHLCRESGELFSKQLTFARGESKPSLIFDTLLSPLLADVKNPEFLLTVTDVTDSQLAADLRETLKELQRSNRELEQFAYSVSHDLNEPLRTVEGFVKLLSKRLKGKVDEKAEEFMQLILNGTGRMKQMIKDILDYSRIRTRGNPLEPVNTGKIMDIVTSNLSGAIEESRAQITCSHLPRVQADEFQLVKLFQNLVSNAIKFRGKKKPRIHIKAQALEHNRKWKAKTDPEISEKYTSPFHHRPPPMWLFSVRDNGIGIDIDSQDKIFNIFKRVHRDEEYPGTGIGLAICKKIVERHGGIIWVESQPNKGSTFYFTIPRATDD